MTDVLNNFSWAEIDEIGQSGLAPLYFNLGDEKTYYINGESIIAVIIGFNHDDLASEGKAPISFGIKYRYAHYGDRMMFSTSGSSLGYSKSRIFDYLEGDAYEELPSDLKQVVKTVKKYTSDRFSNQNIEPLNVKLFLFSEIELTGESSRSVAGEGTRYSWFSSRERLIKTDPKGAGNYEYWTRSHQKNYGAAFCYIGTMGDLLDSSVTNSKSVIYGFCV